MAIRLPPPDTVGRAESDLVELRGMITPKLFIGVRPQAPWVLFSIVSLVLAVNYCRPHAGRKPSWNGWVSGCGSRSRRRSGPLADQETCRGAYDPRSASLIRQAIADGEVYKQRRLADAKAYYDDQRARLAETIGAISAGPTSGTYRESRKSPAIATGRSSKPTMLPAPRGRACRGPRQIAR